MDSHGPWMTEPGRLELHGTVVKVFPLLGHRDLRRREISGVMSSFQSRS